MTKIQFWKQFTTEASLTSFNNCCIQYDKDTILKAIYNYLCYFCHVCSLYSVWQRCNFESNLQPELKQKRLSLGCIQYDKDTILKAIYNTPHAVSCCSSLYSVWQRYNFESNLQPWGSFSITFPCCIQYDKDTILKAIYNWQALVEAER